MKEEHMHMEVNTRKYAGIDSINDMLLFKKCLSWKFQ